MFFPFFLFFFFCRCNIGFVLYIDVLDPIVQSGLVSKLILPGCTRSFRPRRRVWRIALCFIRLGARVALSCQRSALWIPWAMSSAKGHVGMPTRPEKVTSHNLGFAPDAFTTSFVPPWADASHPAHHK